MPEQLICIRHALHPMFIAQQLAQWAIQHEPVQRRLFWLSDIPVDLQPAARRYAELSFAVPGARLPVLNGYVTLAGLPTVRDVIAAWVEHEATQLADVDAELERLLG